MDANVDREEIGKFEAIAAEWWDPHGRFRPLHRLNPLRLEYVAGHVDLAESDVLDVGCGGGLLAEGLATRGAHVTGIDRSPRALAVARLHAKESNGAVRYEESDAEHWARHHAAAYDVVTCLEVLEHVPDPPRTIAACARMLRPGGSLFFATLNRTPKSFLFAILGAEYVLRWLPRGTHRYGKFIRPSELIAALRAAGLEPKEIRGVSYAPLTDRFHLSDDPAVNYLGLATKPA